MIFGMLPLALKLEAGAETRAPMAVVVIGALLSSTVLTLVVVPALYTLVDDLQVRVFGAKSDAPRTTSTHVPEHHVPEHHAPEYRVPDQPSPGHLAPERGGAERVPAERGTRVPLNILDVGAVYLIRTTLPAG